MPGHRCNTGLARCTIPEKTLRKVARAYIDTYTHRRVTNVNKRGFANTNNC